MGEIINLGTININGIIKVTDPMYNVYLNNYCCLVNEMLPGEYECVITMGDDNEDIKLSNRVASLSIIHKNYINSHFPQFVIYDNIGVDSAQCGIFDFEYLKAIQNAPEYEWDEWYNDICNLTSSKNSDKFSGGIIDGKGVIAASGWGDGVYYCYASMNERNQIVSLTIRFI